MVLQNDLRKKIIDGLHNQIKMNRNAISEIENYFDELKIEVSCSGIYFSNTKRESISIMKDFVEEVFLANDGLHQDSNFALFVMENLMESSCDTNKNLHLPNIVFPYIKQTVPTQYVLQILLAMGIFETERDLTHHSPLKESFSYAIGLSNDQDDLKKSLDLKKTLLSTKLYGILTLVNKLAYG